MKILSILGWALFALAWVALVVAMGISAQNAADTKQAQQEALFRERLELSEEKAALCEKRCAQAHELATRSAEALERFESAMGLEVRP